MGSNGFNDDAQDRKRRFLQGLNILLKKTDRNSFDREKSMIDVLGVDIGLFRQRLAKFYGIEFALDELREKMRMTPVEFTDEYCPIIYRDRGDFDFNNLVKTSLVEIDGRPALSLREMDMALKYGHNGNDWCDVVEGPCACGAWHH